jgi:hypothetical protein
MASDGPTLKEALAAFDITTERSQLGAFLYWGGHCFGHADEAQGWILVDMLTTIRDGVDEPI